MKTLFSLLLICVATLWFLTAQLEFNPIQEVNIEHEVTEHSIKRLESEICETHAQREALIKVLATLTNKLSFAEAQHVLTRNGSSFISHLPTLEMANRQVKELQRMQTEKTRLQNELVSTENTLTKLRLSLLLLHRNQVSSSPILASIVKKE